RAWHPRQGPRREPASAFRRPWRGSLGHRVALALLDEVVEQSHEGTVAVGLDLAVNRSHVSGLDQVEQALVTPDGVLGVAEQLLAQAQVHRHAETELLDERLVGAQEPLVPRQRAERKMEGEVRLEQRLAIARGVAHLGDRGAERAESGGILDGERELDREALERPAQRVDLPHVIGVERGDDRPPARAPLDETLLLEQAQRLSQRRPADPEALRQALLDQPFTRLQRTREDQGAELLGDDVDDARGDDRHRWPAAFTAASSVHWAITPAASSA